MQQWRERRAALACTNAGRAEGFYRAIKKNRARMKIVARLGDDGNLEDPKTFQG